MGLFHDNKIDNFSFSANILKSLLQVLHHASDDLLREHIFFPTIGANVGLKMSASTPTSNYLLFSNESPKVGKF